MRAHPFVAVLGVTGCLLVSPPTHRRADAIEANPVQVASDPIETELDAFWNEVSRSVAQGDDESMGALFHPDGVHVGGTPDSYRTRLFSDNDDQLAAGNAETRSGGRRTGIEYRFSSRIHSETAAHEVGLYHYWVTRGAEPRLDSYGVVDAYLVKRDGRWMFLISIQRVLSTEEDWEALRSGVAELEGPPRPALDGPAAASTPVETELDAFWAEVSRTVAEGDFTAMTATYHPDAVHIGAMPGDPTSYRIHRLAGSPARERAEEGTAETRAGLKAPGVEFRFSSRVNNAETAHEVGLYHFWVSRPGEERVDAYGLVDSYLVKRGGRWMILLEIQRYTATRAEWDRLG